MLANEEVYGHMLANEEVCGHMLASVWLACVCVLQRGQSDDELYE